MTTAEAKTRRAQRREKTGDSADLGKPEKQKRRAARLLEKGDFDKAMNTAYRLHVGGGSVSSFPITLLALTKAQETGNLELADSLQRRMRTFKAIYSPRLNLLYTVVPKNACSSMKAAFVEAEGLQDAFRHSPSTIHHFAKSHLAAPEDSQLPDDAKWITILRNPYSRLVSAYLNKVVGSARKPRAHAGRISRLARGLPMPLPANCDISFAEFIQGVAGTQDFEADEHWRQQHIFVGADLSRYAYIGQFEKFSSIIKDLKPFGLHLDLVQRNRTIYMEPAKAGEAADLRAPEIIALGNKPSARSFYREDLVELVQKRFAQDIALYSSAFGSVPQPY